MITKATRIPFGPRGCKGRKINEVDDTLLNWMIQRLKDTDLHEWSLLAQEELKARGTEHASQDLEKRADAILRRAGYNPRKVKP